MALKGNGFITDSPCMNGKTMKKSYSAWKAMVRRCYDTNDKQYKTYGAKGVTVCEEWKLFSNFERWYDENHIEGYSIDKDMSGLNEYSPAGCKFISKSENSKECRARVDYKYLKGSLHYKSRNINEYETLPVKRSTFKSICKTHGLDFDNFTETESDKKCGAHKKYYYKIKGDII